MTNKTIFLIGMMGSGKSTAGKAVAHKLNYTFYDTDEIIMKRERMHISQIFEQKGEAYFRMLEKQVIDNLPSTPSVVACGGGLPCYNDLMDRLQQLGVVIYFEATPECLFERVKGDLNRPLLKNLEAFIQMYQDRKATYQAAQHSINANLDRNQVLLALQKLLN